jgi:hypothetical protein
MAGMFRLKHGRLASSAGNSYLVQYNIESEGTGKIASPAAIPRKVEAEIARARSVRRGMDQ